MTKGNNFSYCQQQKLVSAHVRKIGRKNVKNSDLKKLLIKCHHNGYLAADPKKIDLRKKSNHNKLVTLAYEFANTKLVTQSTIKDRGWTDGLIKKHLKVDIWANNPYYKSSGEMRLYVLQKVIHTEEQPEIKLKLQQNLDRRKKIRETRYHKLEVAHLKWLKAIGDPYIAIALLTRLCELGVKEYRDYCHRKHFDLIKEQALKLLNKHGFNTKNFIVRDVGYGAKYCHWFDVNGYKFSLESYCDLGEDIKDMVPLNNRKYYGYIDKADKALLFKLSGWSSIKQAVSGLEQILRWLEPALESCQSEDALEGIDVAKQRRQLPSCGTRSVFAVPIRQSSIGARSSVPTPQSGGEAFQSLLHAHDSASQRRGTRWSASRFSESGRVEDSPEPIDYKLLGNQSLFFFRTPSFRAINSGKPQR